MFPQVQHTGVAQLVEHWSPKPRVGSSNLSTRAKVQQMKIKTYLNETWTELIHKVSWPTWSDLQNSAVVVMIGTVIISLIIFAMDVSFRNIMEMIYSLFY
jgi:preprotein translocase subunit SecE